jgi:glycosyltransferase involved in cell wall biosynthesis
MRIIYLHQYFTTPDSAGGTRSYEVGRRLVSAGHVVEMVTSWRGSATEKDWFTSDVAGMRVHWISVPYSNHMGYGERIRAFGKFAIAAARRAAMLDGDVIFASSTPLTIALPAAYAASRKRVPMIFEVRDLWPEMPIAMGALRHPLARWLARRLERFAYARSAHVIALSPGMATGIGRAGYPPQRITVVPNGSDLDFFRRDAVKGRAFRQSLGIADDKILVGYAGTLGRVNGVSYLVRLAAALKHDERFCFLIMGDGQEREMIAALARDCAVLDRNLRMVDKMAKEEMPRVLSAVDLAASLFLPIPEMEANSANKFFDALAAGCCVAINYGGWQAELVQEAGAGIRLSPEPERAATELQNLASNPERIRQAGCNARRLAESRFSRDDQAAQIEAVIARAVADHAARRRS